ncbi:histone-lysine N-methyltransferase ASH1L-like isoform X2 [Triplophysa rosa]|uniref:histone-lysine N-methyltransferase ASH1L-like isoform X2 n=1 Tax=Triplophysa rosa TaxID=992332 RepID=UPI002546296E|nr:histone-lysine N-methyltransferase ASH1L-like isoform X2 [Triplophysa rosa]
MDKKKQKTAPAPSLERDKHKKREDGKKMRKAKEGEAEVSSKSTKSESQLQSRQDEVTVMKSDQSEANGRMKIGFVAKRTKKPPKSLENFICRPTARISQRLSHGDGQSSCGGDRSSSDITGAIQSCQESQKKDSNDCISSNASTTPLSTSSKKVDSTLLCPPSKKTASKQTKKTDSKSLLTSDGPSYTAQPQTDSKVPLSHRITSSTPLKQTYSPPAAHSPPSSIQQNSSLHNGTQVFNVQRGKGEDFPTGATVTVSLPSQSSKDTRLKAHTSQQSSSSFQNEAEHSLCCSENSQSSKPKKKSKTSTFRDSKVDKCLNASVKEDSKQGGDSTNKTSKENESAHQPSPSMKTPAVLPASNTSAGLSDHENSTSQRLESKGKNKKHNIGGDIDDSRKRTLEPTQTIPVVLQSKDISSVGHIIDKKRVRHSSDHEENMQCSSQTSSSADSQYNTSIRSTDKTSDETHLHPKQFTNPDKKLKVVQMTKVANQVEKMDLVETVGSTACKTVPQTANLSKISAFKSSKTSPQCKPRPVGRPPKTKQLQNPSPRSDVSSPEPQTKKRGRPKIIRLDESPQGSGSHKSLSKSPIIEHTNVRHPEVDLKLQKPVQRKRGRPRLSFSVQPQRSESLGSESVKKSAEDNLKPPLSKTKDAQICRKRNKLIMKTIIKNINKMRMKKRDEVLTQFISGQKQSSKEGISQKGNEGEVDCSVSDPTQSLSSLVTSFGGKLGPQINVSKRGTIYIGKRRGRKPKAQRENSGQDSEQILFQKSQKVAESTSQMNSWFTPGGHSNTFETQPALSSSFKSPESLRKKPYTDNCEYDKHSAPKVTSSQKVKAMADDKSRPRSSLRSTPLNPATTQLGSVRMQDCRAAHVSRSVLMEKERLNYKCHRKGHNFFSRDKIRRHKHKCKRKYLQLRAKRQDPAFLAEIEELVVRLSAIRIVHHVAQGDEAKSGRKSLKAKNHPHVLQCLPQNLHHPTMFQINFSGYYSPQSDFPRDSLHYVGMADLKRNNGCPSQPSEHIVTHCPMVHKLGFPLTGGSCYHSPCKLPLSASSFGFGLYRGYPPSATIYPSSPFLASYVHPYSKNPILSPSKFHKRKQKFLRRDPLCGGKPQGTYPNVTSQSSSDWFGRNSWQRVDNRDKRHEQIRGRAREEIDGLLGQSKLRKDNVSKSASSSNSLFSSSMPTRKADKHKASHLSYIGPAHLRPTSKVRWAEHQRPWRWRGSVQSERSNSRLDQEAASGYQENETFAGQESDEDLPSPSWSDRTIHHNTFLQNPNLASSAKSRMTVQRSAAEVQGDSRNLMRPGSSWMRGSCLTGGKRASESFRPGGPVFHGHRQRLTEGQDAEGRDLRCNISRTLIQTREISPFSSSTATKTSLSHSSSTHLSKSKHVKRVKKPLTNKSFQSQTGTGSEAKRRGRGRPRKNPAPCFSPSLPTAPLLDGVSECPSKRRKGETDDNTVLSGSDFVSQCEKRKVRKKRDCEKLRDGGHDEQETDLSQEPSSSHSRPSLPSHDTSVSAHSQSERNSAKSADKQYEWAGLYSDVYKTKDPMRPSSPENTECLDYDPEKHQHGLLPAPIHVGKYLRLKRIDFQLPYDIYWLRAHNKLPKISDSPQKTATSNGSVGVMSLTQPEDRSYKHHTDSVPHDCISDSLNKDDSLRLPAEEVAEETSQTDPDEKLPNQRDPLKQQERGSDAENISSPLLIMPLSCEERSFISEHCIFLLRNYEKMRVRQAVLLREGVREREKEKEESEGSNQCQTGGLEDNTSTKRASDSLESSV